MQARCRRSRVYGAIQILALLLAALGSGAGSSHAEPMTLWYRQPAGQWVEALPVGNGRLGAMVFGGVEFERIQFNEDTLWIGEPRDYSHPGAAAHLPMIRRMLFEGRQKEAEEWAMKTFMSVPLRQLPYQPFADVQLRFPGHSQPERYRRELNLAEAIARTDYSIGDVHFTREVLASAPHNIIAIRIAASKRGSLSFMAEFVCPHTNSAVRANGPRSILVRGRMPDSFNERNLGLVFRNPLQFEAQLEARVEGGTVTADQGRLVVTNADAVTLVLAAATSFRTFQDVRGDPSERCAKALAATRRATWKTIREAHVRDHRRLFDRVSIDLGPSPNESLPTDERLKRAVEGEDPGLAALVFQYGRYLLIGSSRPGSQPANLQGVWNESLRPPWDSKYTCNINTEMNYWPAESANLAECAEPLFDALDELAVSGRRTARTHYDARGWVLHHNFDLWRGTAPINAANHGIWPSGGAWLSLHLWEHYLYSQDKTFLQRRAYPVMKEAALFFEDFLVTDPKTGWLISGPSNSPEQGGLVMGPTMDHQIVRTLFAACSEAARVLDRDSAWAAELDALRARIAPNQIGKHGQLQEWLTDIDDPANTHRHVSHLWGLHPGSEITWRTPDLFRAARQSLVFRGDEATGWSMGWKVNFWARLLDGDHAWLILRNLLAPVGSRAGGGLYPNLFDAHPPFQIDGNFGATAGMVEMLLQSHIREENGEFLIHLLPALPRAWPTGRVTGLRARGGIEVDLEWREGALNRVVLRNVAGDDQCHLRYGGASTTVTLPQGKTRVLNGALQPFAAN